MFSYRVIISLSSLTSHGIDLIHTIQLLDFKMLFVVLIEVLNIAATGYGLKFFLAASLTPILYIIKGILTEKYGLKPLPANSEE